MTTTTTAATLDIGDCRTSFVVNPSGDLTRTENTFRELFCSFAEQGTSFTAAAAAVVCVNVVCECCVNVVVVVSTLLLLCQRCWWWLTVCSLSFHSCDYGCCNYDCPLLLSGVCVTVLFQESLGREVSENV